MGFKSLRNSTTGGYNTANGYNALYSNTTGNYNTANGRNALLNDADGDYNNALRYQLSTGASYTNAAGIGYDAPGASNTIRLGNNSVTWIEGALCME